MYLTRLFSIQRPDSSHYDNGELPADEILHATWHKSSRSTYNGSCVEVAHFNNDRVGVRDTKDRGVGSVLCFSQREWSDFLTRAKAGEFDSI
jgi:hypothetical protein